MHTSVRGLFPKNSNIRFSLPPFTYLGFRPHNQKSGIQQLSPSRRRRTGPRGQTRLSPPSPPGEASRARPSGRAKAEEEVARGKVSFALSLLGRAAGGPQEEAEALGHHSDPYQVRHGVQGRGSLCLA